MFHNLIFVHTHVLCTREIEREEKEEKIDTNTKTKETTKEKHSRRLPTVDHFIFSTIIHRSCFRWNHLNHRIHHYLRIRMDGFDNNLTLLPFLIQHYCKVLCIINPNRIISDKVLSKKENRMFDFE